MKIITSVLTYLAVISFFTFGFLFVAKNNVYAALSCNIQLRDSPPFSTSDLIFVTPSYVITDGQTRTFQITVAKNGHQVAGLGGQFTTNAGSSSGPDRSIGSFTENGTYTISARMFRNMDSGTPEITSCANTLTVTISDGTSPPSPTPTPPPGNEPNCKMTFADGSTANKAMQKGESITVKVAKTGETSPFWGNTFVIKLNGHQVSEGQNSYTFTSDQNGTYVFSAYLVVTGTPRVEHFCSGGTVTVEVNDTGIPGGVGIPGKNPCGTGPEGEIGGECPTALGSFSSNATEFIGKVLEISLGIAGAIALILMVIGSIRVMASSGDQQRLNGGREMIIAAVAGLLFLVFSVLILQFIDTKLITIGFK